MNKWVTSVVCGIVGFNGFTIAAETRPKLVVGIVVDQLRTDYIEYLQDLFTDGGFKRLMRDGAFIRDLDYKVPSPDVANATAILQTGSYPRHNGVASENIFNLTDKTIVPVFNDPAYIGNFTSETLSPSALLVTTLSDEISEDSNGASKIHAIAPNSSQAIALAGHLANSAFWINDNTGNWATTTYYKENPSALLNKNYNNPLVSRIDTMKWTPLLKGVTYPEVSGKRISEGFKYTFPRSDRDLFPIYKTSPMSNADVTEAAIEYIRDLNLGKTEGAIDMIGLGLSVAPYAASSQEDYRYELEDAYLRIDRNIGNLLNVIDRYVGLDNTLVYLASTGYFSHNTGKRNNPKLPGGTFSVKRAVSLLNSYLSAKYGNGTYINQYVDNHIYLDRNYIEEHGLNLNQVAEEARDFLVRMSGVSDAYTVADLMSPAVPQLEGHRLASDPKTSGDVILEFNPGWEVVDDTKFPSEIQIEKSTAFEAPAFILGAGVAPQTIESSVDAVAIAPTVARLLRIRSPNGATENPLPLKKK